MNELAASLERKFTVAEQLYFDGKSPFITEEGTWGLRYELIGLDCESGGDQCYRYVVSRCSLDTRPIGMHKGAFGNPDYMDITNFMVRFPRMKGDHRALEDLPDNSLVGDLVLIDSIKGIVFEPAPENPHVYSDLAVKALAERIDQLRVAERMPALV